MEHEMLALLFMQQASCYFMFSLMGRFIDKYESVVAVSKMAACIVFCGAVFVMLYGAYYPRISLSPYIAALVYYNFAELNEKVNSIPSKHAEKYFVSAETLDGFKGFFGSMADNPTIMFIVSFAGACIVVWALELIQNLILILGLYIIYSMFFSLGFQVYKDTYPIPFYLALGASFMILCYITQRLLRYTFVVLFAVTGSFVALTCIEFLVDFDMGFVVMVDALKDEYGIDASMSSPLIVWAVTSIVCMVWQTRYIGKKEESW